MPRRPRRRAGLAAALALALLATAAAQAQPTLPLAHSGRFVTDAQGRVVIVHGLNMVQKLPPYYPSAIGFDDDDAAFLAANGFNAVRVGVIYKALEPKPGVYDDAYLEQIAATVAMLGRHGIASLLDFHQDLFNERFQGEGFPDWAVQDDGLPAQPQLGFPGNYLGMAAENRVWDHFWANSPGPGGVGLQDRYAAAWRHVAERFRGDADVLGYELLNEPWPGSVYPSCLNPLGCPAFDAAQLTGLYKRVLAAIRQADSRTLVWYEPNVIFNDGADTGLGQLGDAHAGFAFHDYCLPEPSTGSNTGCDTFDNLVFANAAKRAAATGDATLMTEWGANKDTANLEAMLGRADRNMVGWVEWAYCGCNDPTTSGPGATQALVLDPSKPPTGANVEQDKLKLLAEPYPQLVAGTPTQFGYDPAARSFKLDYRTAPAGAGAGLVAGAGAGLVAGAGAGLVAGALTEIFVPALLYPDGFGYRVDGASIVPGRDRQHLLLRNDAGASGVSVVITPGGPGAPLPGSGSGSGSGGSGGSGRSCRGPRAVTLAVSQRGGRVVRVAVYLGRRRLRTVRGRRVTAVRVALPAGRDFTIKLIATTSRHRRRTLVLRYHFCAAR